MVRVRFLVIILIFLALPLSVSATSSDTQNISEWRMDGRNLNGTHYYPGPIPGDLSQLTANTYAAGASAGDPVIVNNEFYGLALRSKIVKLNATNISQEIQVVSSSNVYQTPVAPIWDNFIYTGHENGNIIQRNISNISQTIATNSLPNGQHYSSPIVYEEYVYFTDWHSSSGNYIYQVNASNVTQWFERYSISNCDGGPRIANGFYYHVCGSSNVLQLNATNVSQLISQKSIGGGYDTGSSLAIANGFLYFGNDNDILYQLNASNLSQTIATYTTGGDIDTTPAVANGYVYIVSNDGYTYQLNASNVSQHIANYSTGTTSEGITVTDDYLLVGGTSALFQLDAKDISKQVSNYTVSSADTPVIVNGNIYFAAGNTFYQLNPTLPVAGLLSPVNGYEINPAGENINFNCTGYATEGLKNISLYITDKNNANFLLNQTINFNGTGNKTGWTLSLQEGNYTWGCLTYDTQNTSDWSANRTLTPDQTLPSISILNPVNDFNTTNTVLNVTYLVSDDNLDSCWYSNDTMTSNITLASCINITNVTWSEGQHNVTIWANDTQNNIGNITITFTIDLTGPVFVNFSNQSIGEGRAFSYGVNTTDTLAIDCFSVNDTTNFTIDCDGNLVNNTIISQGLYWLNISVNDTVGNVNSKIINVNVTKVGKINLDILYPTQAINASQNSFINYTVNVTCTRADCGNINLTFAVYFGNESDVDVAYVCYDASCTLSDDIRTFLENESFQLTSNQYTTWTDATLNITAFDVIVVGGYYLTQDYAFDSASDPARDAFEDEGLPAVILADECDACLDMGITTTDGNIDYTQTSITNISTHNIMTGYSGTVTISVEDNDLGYYTDSIFNDEYTSLFAGQSSDRVSGFAMNPLQATTGTNSSRFVWLGWDTQDSYSPETDNDGNITKQAICWAATGSYDCVNKENITTDTASTPFYSNETNPKNISLNENESIAVTFWLNATGSLTNFEVIVDAFREDDRLVTNSSNKENITIISSDVGPTVTFNIPAQSSFSNDENQDVNYTVTGTFDECWYSTNLNSSNISLSSCTNITSATWIDANHSVTVWANDTNGNEGSAILNFTIDITYPSILLLSPSNGTNSNNNSLDISYYINDTFLDSCWYSNDTMTTNTTLASCANITTINWTDALHNVTIWVNDSVGNVNSTNLQFTIDGTNPTWTGNKTNISVSLLGNVYFNITLSDSNPDKYIFGFYNGSSWSNDSVATYTNSQEISIVKSITQNSTTLNWTWYFNDTFGNQNQTDIWSKYVQTQDNINPLIDYSTLTPNNSTIQSQQNVLLNFSIQENYIDEIIYNWNGTNYTMFNDSLVLLMNFDNYSALGENSTFVVDNSKYGNNGTHENSEFNISGRYGGAAHFDAGDYISAGNDASLNLGVGFTLSAWAYLESHDVGYSFLIAKDGAGGGSYDLGFKESKPYVAISNGTWTEYVGDTNFPTGEWHHLAGVRDSANNLYLYYDGKLNKTFTSVKSAQAVSTNVTIGRRSSTGYEYIGLIDQVMIWNRTLSTSEIDILFKSNLRKYDTNKFEFYVNQSLNVTNLLSDGNYTYFSYVSDVSGNQNKTSPRTLVVDTTSPIISITSPSNNSFVNTIDSNISYTISDVNLDVCWYSNDSMTTNITLTNCENITSVNWTEGQHNVTIWANDSVGNTNSTSVMFTIDITYPSINITIPENISAQSNQSTELNFTITENYIDEIIYNWNGTNYTMFNDSLVLLMNFDNYSALGENSTYVVDNSKYGNNGTITGALWNATGRYSGAYEFGGNDYINLSNYSSLDMNEQTVSAWLKTNIVNGAWHFAYGAGSDNWAVDYGISQANKWGIEFQNSSNSAVLLEGSTPVAGQWTHLVFSYNRTTVVLYENGVKVNHSFITGDMYPSTKYYIGRKYDGSFKWNGTVDELKIWNRSLSSEEVYQVYASNLRKYETNKFEFYVNQSLNSTTLLSDGNYTYYSYVKDLSGNQNQSSVRTFTIDSTPPVVTLNNPANNYVNDSVSPLQITLNCSVTEVVNLSNVSLYITDRLNQSFTKNYSINRDSTSASLQISLNLITGNYTWNCLAYDNVGNFNWSTNRSFILNGTTDTDNDGIEDSSDTLLYNESNVTSSGITILNISIAGNRTSEIFSGSQEVNFFDDGTLLVNFTHNFSSTNLDLSKVRIFKDENSIVFNSSGQLQNKTLYLSDNSFASLCVKDVEINNASNISEACNQVNETDFTNCLGSSLTINGTICTDLGSTIKIENLRHSGVKGIPVSSSSTSSSSSSSGGSGSSSIIYANKKNQSRLKYNLGYFYNIDINDVNYRLRVIEINDDEAKLETSDKLTFKLILDKNVNVDLDNDGNDDAIFKLLEIGFKKIFLKIDPLNALSQESTLVIEDDKDLDIIEKEPLLEEPKLITEEEEEKSYTNYFLFIAIVLILILIALAIYKRKREKELEDLIHNEYYSKNFINKDN